MVQGTASIADALPRRPRRSSVPCTWDAWSAWRRRHIDRPARLSTPRAPSPSALAGTRRRASCRPGSRPGPSPSQTRACRRRVRPDNASKAGESVGCRRGRGRRTRPPPPFACCRKSRAGKLRHKRRRRDRARRTPSPASRENRRARTACGYRTAASAPASLSTAVHAVRSPRGSRSYGEVDSDRRSGRVRLRPRTLETAMQSIAERHEEPTAIQTNLGAIFVSLELSRSIWLVTSVSPGGGETMSKHNVPAGAIAALLARFAELKKRALARTGKTFPIIVIQEAGLDGFWIHRALQREGIESYVVDAASIATSRRRRRAKTDRIDGEALVRALLAYKRGEPRVCAMV